MTYIKTNKNNFRLASPLLLLGLGILSAISLEVYIYSQTVNLKHDIITLSRNIESVRLENADLKNQFYSLTDKTNLEKVAARNGFVQDNNPKWVFASQF